MHKLILFSALIVGALATWSPSEGHQQRIQEAQHQVTAGHKVGVGHPEHAAGVGHGHERKLKTTRGQLESVKHGYGAGGALFNQQFRRVKKGQNKKHLQGNRGKNHLRRAQPRKHYKH